MLTAEMKAAGWKDMETAPGDGSIFVVYFHEWNKDTNPIRYQLAQKLPALLRQDNNFHHPWEPDNEVYANGWMTLADFATYRQETTNAD